jgi:hypothetical protein
MLFTRSWLAALGVLVAGFVVPAQGQTILRYQFKEGEKLHYVMEQKMTMKMKVMDMDVETDMTQTFDMSWNILSVGTDGSARMTQKFERIRFIMNGPTGKTEFDSKDGKLPDDAVGQAMAPVFKALTGLEFSMTMEPTGALKDVKVPEAFLKALKDSTGGAGMGDMFSEENLKHMISQGGIVFPKDGVTKGQTWEQKMAMKMPFGKMSVTTTCTYQGPVTRGGRTLEAIGLKPVVKIEADPKSQATITLKSQDVKGAGYFDNKTGRLVETAMTQNLEMEISADGQTITAKMQQHITLKLQEK